jgi:electron transfer flavoprotein alpha subunit
MSTLVIAEHHNGAIKAPTLVAVAAAQAIGGDIDILVAGADCADAAAAAARIGGVTRVRVADNAVYAHGLAENIADLVVAIGTDYSHIVAVSTTSGKNFMPRVAALLDVAQISDISLVISADTFERPIYAGNAIATVQSSDAIKVLTVRGTAYDAASAEGGSATIENLDIVKDAGLSTWVKDEIAKMDRPELTAASIIVSGCRGMQSAENFKLLESVADKLGAAIGASRAAVDAGYAPNDMQVGQTGKLVAPDLYIAVGISGAIQHLAGMKDSKVIVAINKDADAPIFQVADYGLVADLFKAVPEFDVLL